MGIRPGSGADESTASGETGKTETGEDPS